jgi:hypothetical protein
LTEFQSGSAATAANALTSERAKKRAKLEGMDHYMAHALLL